VLEAAARADARNARWTLGLAIVAMQQRDSPKALELAERAAGLDPKSADIQYWLGMVTFANIGEVSLIRKGSVASRGKRAWERAIELDPNHADTHEGLAGFYTFAPGVMGGSLRKAREHADALLEIENAAHRGHSMHAAILAYDKKWADMGEAYRKAEAAAPDDEARRSVLRGHASSLLYQKEDPKAALVVIGPLLADSAEDSSLHHLAGTAHQRLQQHREAAEAYERVLAINPEARNSRFAVAECYAALNEREKAIAAFQAFLARFPDDDRAKDATREVRRLQRGR
jgi:tetratricopeptide (TPR) repeat protein